MPLARVFLVLVASCLLVTPASGQTGRNVLRPGDEVSIRVWPDTTISGRFRVETDGSVYLPMIGGVPAVGLTSEELRASLIEAYSSYIESPVVVAVPRFRVSVLGAVRAPGLYFVEPPATIIDAVSMAGGFLEQAEPENMRLIRGEQVYTVDARAALETGAPTAAVPLESGDRVVVPSGGGVSAFEVLRTVMQIATLGISIYNVTR